MFKARIHGAVAKLHAHSALKLLRLINAAEVESHST